MKRTLYYKYCTLVAMWPRYPLYAMGEDNIKLLLAYLGVCERKRQPSSEKSIFSHRLYCICIAGVLQELVMIGGAAALGALVPLAAGAAGAARGGGSASSARGAGRARAHLHTFCAQRHAHHQPLAQIYRPYHKFIGEYVTNATQPLLFVLLVLVVFEKSQL